MVATQNAQVLVFADRRAREGDLPIAVIEGVARLGSEASNGLARWSKHVARKRFPGRLALREALLLLEADGVVGTGLNEESIDASAVPSRDFQAVQAQDAVHGTHEGRRSHAVDGATVRAASTARAAADRRRRRWRRRRRRGRRRRRQLRRRRGRRARARGSLARGCGEGEVVAAGHGGGGVGGGGWGWRRRRWWGRRGRRRRGRGGRRRRRRRRRGRRRRRRRRRGEWVGEGRVVGEGGVVAVC